MIEDLYIEEAVRDYPITLNILSRYPDANVTYCKRYTEIFNRKSQNFRLQKKQPALILARKHKNYVLETPENYGIGSKHNYYFSHMMNCIYDCRYCFLQGMYRSANYVVFVNYHDFFEAITETAQKHDKEETHFFSGYDCDSLALEPITHFIENSLPLFEATPKALLEIRTKSTQIRPLLKTDVIPNVVTAYSLSPKRIAAKLEHKTASPEKRLQAIEALQKKGWKTGFRFDPIIYCKDFEKIYGEFFEEVFNRVDIDKLHSVSLGSFRLPTAFYKTLSKLYPEEKLFASPFEDTNGMVSYPEGIKESLLSFCKETILQHIPEDKFFPCDE